MTEEQKQQYIKIMNAKAFAYAENALSDIKDFLPKDEYQEALKDFAQAFVSGGDAAIDTAREIINTKDNCPMDRPTEVYLCVLRHDDGKFKMIAGCFYDYDRAVRYADGSPRTTIHKQKVI